MTGEKGTAMLSRAAAARERAQATADFRAELAGFLDGRAARGLLAQIGADPARHALREIYRALGEKRLLAPSWPVELGGRGLPAAATAACAEELVAHGVPDMPHVISIQTVGTAMIGLADRTQCMARLPRLAAGEAFACVLFTEPEAGSDLARLSATALRKPDGYELTGTKTYCLGAGQAEFGLCLARGDGPDPSVYLVDLAAPGVTAIELGLFTTERFYRVELDRVRLGADALIGEARDGRRHLLHILTAERTGIDYAARAGHWFTLAHRVAAERAHGASPVPPGRLARLGAQADAARLVAHRAAAALHASRLSQGGAALAKWFTSEAAAEIAWTGAQWCAGADRSPDTEVLAAAQFEAPGLLVSGGASEVLAETLGRTLRQRPPAGAVISDEEDELDRQLRRALGTVGRSQRPEEEFGRLGAFGFGVAVENGGLGLGQRVVLSACFELGRAGCGPWYPERLLAADLLAAARAQHRDQCQDQKHDRVRPGPTGAALLASVVDGEQRVGVLGLGGPGAWDFRVRPADGGWTLSGRGLLHDPLLAARGGPSSAVADRLLVFARDPEQTGKLLVLVDADSGGVEIRRDRGGPSAEADPPRLVVLREVPVAAADVLAADEDAGRWREAAWPAARLRLAGYLAGLGVGALEAATEYAETRILFGSALAQLPVISARTAALAAHAEAALLLLDRLAELLEGGLDPLDPHPSDPLNRLDQPDAPDRAKSGRLAVLAAEATAFAAEFALDATREAVHLHGARAMIAGHPVHRYFRLAAQQASRFGDPDALWAQAGAARLRWADCGAAEMTAVADES